MRVVATTLMLIAAVGCGSTKTVTETVTKTVTETQTTAAATDTTTAPTETTASPSRGDLGRARRSGGITIKLLGVRSSRMLTYEGGTQSDITPNATAVVKRAPQGGRFIYVKTTVKNNRKGGIDLTCGLPVQAELQDADGTSYDAVDGLDQLRGNPACNAMLQHGFKTTMIWVYLVPPGAKPATFAFKDVTDLNGDEDPGYLDLPVR